MLIINHDFITFSTVDHYPDLRFLVHIGAYLSLVAATLVIKHGILRQLIIRKIISSVFFYKLDQFS